MNNHSNGDRRRAAVFDAVVITILIVLLWGHALRGAAGEGFVLLRDAVSTPNPPLSDAALGIGPVAARAVPQDVAMWAAQGVFRALGLPTALVLPLLVSLALAVLGAAARAWVYAALSATPYRTDSTKGDPATTAGVATPTTAPEGAGALSANPSPNPGANPSWAVRLPALVMALWNPFVVERLLQGHWSLLLGVAAAAWLPLLVMTPTSRHCRVRRVAAVLFLIALAAFTPTGLIMAATMTIAALLSSAIGAPRAKTENRRSHRSRAIALVVAGGLVVAALPVVTATVLGWGAAATAAGHTEAGVTAFAARAEPGLGTLGSLASLGGMWNADAVPPSRAQPWTWLLALPMLAAWGIACWLLSRRIAPSLARRLARWAVSAAGIVCVLIAAAATGPGRGLLTEMISAVPALGVVRDGQKWLGLALPGAIVAVALLAQWISRIAAPLAEAATRSRLQWCAAVAVLVPLLNVPDAATALRAEFVPTHYGPGWQQVNEILRETGDTAPLIVLPSGSLRSSPLWAGGRVVLDPAPRLLHTEVLSSGDLLIGSRFVGGEGTAARAAEAALLRGAPATQLRHLGVGWVLHERTSRGENGRAAETLRGAELRYRDAELELWQMPVPPDNAASTHSEASIAAEAAAANEARQHEDHARRLALIAHALWAAMLLGALAAMLVPAAPAAPAARRARPQR